MDHQVWKKLDELEHEMSRLVKILQMTKKNIQPCVAHEWERCKRLDKMVCKVCGKHGIQIIPKKSVQFL